MSDDAALAYRWLQLWQRLGAERDGLADTGRRLIAAYDGPGRYYHTRRHLEDVLDKLDWSKTALAGAGDILSTPLGERELLFDMIELALWYHDAIYDARQKDNESKSRDLFLADAAHHRLPEHLCTAVARLIDATAGHKSATWLPEKILCDCDLAILGAPEAAFAEYDANIRLEYAHVPAPLYRTARRNVLRSFLRTQPLFQTRAFQQRFEHKARWNLQKAVSPLLFWLKSLFESPLPP